MASRAPEPFTDRKMWRGRRPLPVNAEAQYGCGRLKTALTVYWSTRSMRMMSSNAARLPAAVAGSIANSQLKMTSSAVKGAPSCQVTPRLSLQTTHCPSLASVPAFRLGSSWARTGTRVPSGAAAASGS